MFITSHSVQVLLLSRFVSSICSSAKFRRNTTSFELGPWTTNGHNLAEVLIALDATEVFWNSVSLARRILLVQVVEIHISTKEAIRRSRDDGGTPSFPGIGGVASEALVRMVMEAYPETIEEIESLPRSPWRQKNDSERKRVQNRLQASKVWHQAVKYKGRLLATGLAVGEGAVAGRVCLIESPKDIDHFIDGCILVTQSTDPDWVAIMKRAAAIITDHGGRTSNAAIVSCELGLPAVVGTGTATYYLHNGQDVTVSCAEGDTAFVYEGLSQVSSKALNTSDIPATSTKVMLNLANPAAAYRWWHLPCDGIGLARMEFVVSNSIRVHPMALVHFDRISHHKAKKEIEQLTAGYQNKPDYFVDKLSRGLASLCAAQGTSRKGRVGIDRCSAVVQCHVR